MIILADLSKRLGIALKIKSYYKLLYATSIIIIAASGIDLAVNTIKLPVSPYIPLLMRLVSSIIAFVVCLRYWNWLFPEFFKK